MMTIPLTWHMQEEASTDDTSTDDTSTDDDHEDQDVDQDKGQRDEQQQHDDLEKHCNVARLQVLCDTWLT